MLYIPLALLGLLIVFILIVATRPAAFRIERQKEIAEPPETIFSLLIDFHQWSHWSPWEKLDPNLKRTYSGAPFGVGAIYDWSGNNKAGVGRMTIEESKPEELVSIKLEFIKPFTATNQAIFKLIPINGGTRVIWSMEGRRNFMMKAFGLLMDMDKLVGKDFEQGLTNLDAAAKKL